jgi:hypothetical protein
MVEQVNLEIKRGDTWSRIISFENEDKDRINITGWTIFFTIKVKADDLDTAATTIAKTISPSNPLEGEAEISLTSTDTKDVGNYIFDIQVKTNLNEIITVLEGTIKITQDITIRKS